MMHLTKTAPIFPALFTGCVKAPDWHCITVTQTSAIAPMAAKRYDMKHLVPFR